MFSLEKMFCVKISNQLNIIFHLIKKVHYLMTIKKLIQSLECNKNSLESFRIHYPVYYHHRDYVYEEIDYTKLFYSLSKLTKLKTLYLDFDNEFRTTSDESFVKGLDILVQSFTRLKKLYIDIWFFLKTTKKRSRKYSANLDN